MTFALQVLIQHLPLSAQENKAEATAVNRDDLIAILHKQGGLAEESYQTTIKLAGPRQLENIVF